MKKYEINEKKKNYLVRKGYKLCKEWEETKWRRRLLTYGMWALPFILWGVLFLYLRYIGLYDARDADDRAFICGMVFGFPAWLIGIFYHRHLFRCVYSYVQSDTLKNSLITTEEGIHYTSSYVGDNFELEHYIKYKNVRSIIEHSRRQYLEIDASCEFTYRYENGTMRKTDLIEHPLGNTIISLWWTDNEGLLRELEEKSGKKIIVEDY